MTYASTPDWDYFGWSHLGTLTETIRTDYRTEWSAGWNSTFNCCYAGWIHTKVSD
ncbi:MAG TPA: hypothetical protein VFK32_08230 [Tepidiformaceae bacterium]|nr:hypothetical protein [Tepidiformaceae bacterium]